MTLYKYYTFYQYIIIQYNCLHLCHFDKIILNDKIMEIKC